MSQLNAKNVDLFVYTEREGALSAVGHDLKLRVSSLTASVDGDELIVEVAADSLKVEACIVDGKEKSVSIVDRKVIERNTAKDVLEAGRHPKVTYRGRLERAGDAFVVRGELSIRGTTEALELPFESKGDRWHASASLDQREWGIEPYTAFLGTLKIKPTLRIEAWVPKSAVTV